MTAQPTLFDLPPQPLPRLHQRPHRPAVPNAPCRDCGVDTLPGSRTIPQCKCSPNCLNGTKVGPRPVRAEYYMVHAHVWAAAGMGRLSGYLCVGCIEQRLGRRLTVEDFQTDLLINDLTYADQGDAFSWRTARLRDRLRGAS